MYVPNAELREVGCIGDPERGCSGAQQDARESHEPDHGVQVGGHVHHVQRHAQRDGPLAAQAPYHEPGGQWDIVVK